MSNLTHGMDLAAVEELGRFLQARAGDLDGLARTIDGSVRSTSWVGPDAQRFTGDWWPAHQKRIVAMAETLRGFGQSALDNASDQRRASDAVIAGPGGGLGAAAAAAAAAVAGGVAAARASLPGGSPAPGRGGSTEPNWGNRGMLGPPEARLPDGYALPGQPGAAAGKLPGSDRSPAEVDAAYRNATGLGNQTYGKDAEYQCTAWAKFRWQELNYLGGPVLNTALGHGGGMAARMGGTTETPPTLGAMASYSDGSYGHVMIVEEVYPDGRFRVSEMNMGGNGADLATADEYRSDRTFTRQANGTWVDSGGRNRGAITFAGLPT